MTKEEIHQKLKELLEILNDIDIETRGVEKWATAHCKLRSVYVDIEDLERWFM